MRLDETAATVGRLFRDLPDTVAARLDAWTHKTREARGIESDPKVEARIARRAREAERKRVAEQPTPPEWNAWSRGEGRCSHCEGLPIDDFGALCDCFQYEREFGFPR